MSVRLRFFSIALFSLLLINCRGNSTVTGPEIFLNFGFEPATIDPALATDPPTIQVARLLFLNLVDLNDSDGSPQPALAREWLVSSDGLVWEFRLRQDASWVQYTPTTSRSDKKRGIDANDVVYSAQRLFDPRTASSFAPLFAPLIRNAGALNKADPRTSPQDLEKLAQAIGVKAKDPYTVQFLLTRPMSAFPTLAATWLGRVQPKEPIADEGLTWAEPGTIWTSGAYMLERWEHNQAIVLKKNPFYVDANNVQAERLRFKMIPDVGSAIDAYQRGDLDTTDPYDSIEGNDLARVNEDQALSKDKRVLPGLCTQYIGFNVSQPPFDDARVRVAFATALNRDDIVTRIFKTGQAARWFTPPSLTAAPTISSTINIQFNAPQAKDLLEQSGWGIGKKKMPLLTFGLNTNDTFQQVVNAAIGNWKASLSAEISADADDWQAYLEKLRTDPPSIFRMGYCAAYPDAANFAYDVFHSGSSYNFTRWSNPSYDKLVEQAARETDSNKRRALYLAAEKMLVQEQAVIIPLVWTTRVSLTHSKLERSYALMEGYDHIEKWRVTR